MKLKLFKSANERYLKKFDKVIKKINALEPEIQALTDAELAAKTTEFKERLKQGETLKELLPEAFGVVREAAKRTLGLRPFDVQLLGGMVLFDDKIAEMRTGEGKTLVATLPVYLNALTGKGVHVVTVNDYLASRDSEWMGKIYRFLGMSVGCIVANMPNDKRREAYACDITYGTNNEFGFDYLRDNMCFSKAEMVQRPFHYAIVDEVDSILIDEARTPLIISGRAEDSSDKYKAVDAIMIHIRPEHYEKDEKHKNVTLTELGTEFVENALREAGLMTGSLYDTANIPLVHYVEQALRAHTLFNKDVDYIVKDGKVMIIDEFTGRIMDGRRYSNGLHQALEAKEGVMIQPENQTLASITFQNYFRMYPHLAGMTGTALTEAAEFDDIYKLIVIDVPTNKPLARKDEHDVIFRTAAEKYDAIIKDIEEAHRRGQPILVGTTSIEKSEILAKLLKEKTNLSFNVLNARHHEQEAQIIAQAGVPGAITIATNMAGRGTDIQLGGNFDMRLKAELEKNPEANPEELSDKIHNEIAAAKEVALKAGGLYVLGSERHESRRIDNQLRGRSGRQGDPGLSKFYVSLEDDLMRIFGSERIGRILQTMGLKQGQSIVHPWISKAIAKAQQKVESFHFDVRKNLLKYDDVMNEQRKIIYEQRRQLLETDSVHDIIGDMRKDAFESVIYSLAPERSVPDDWDAEALRQAVLQLTNIDIPFDSWKAEPGMTPEEMVERLCKKAEEVQNQKWAELPQKTRDELERSLLVQSVDQLWKEHLQSLDFMKTSIGLRAYGQKNPLNEYKHDAFILFQNMLERIRERICQVMAFSELRVKQAEQEKTPATPAKEEPAKQQENLDIPRNAPCPCGSGKKYKHCCGKLA
ncbi:MAG: preprotein translocase subunit SecA [Alphaproteobacteria bacterium]